ncbi:MAG TPA: sulfatase-like hydrolase/transferase [Thermoanaerobaculia bacterium]|nr:sulfatase-like hydrolase/transferase [Thermoanaerobaculia bacterium]
MLFSCNRRRRVGGAPLLLLLLAFCTGEQRRSLSEPPIILISIDTLRADRLAAYGSNRVATPAIDRLAADGIVFENAYAQAPLTLPSHASMLTGKLPYQTGVRSNIGYRLDAATPSLPKLLAARGYTTGGAISAYVLRGETGIGPMFDFYDDSLEVFESASLGALQRNGDETVRAALGWLDGVRDKPPFLFLHLFEPHTPYEAVEPFKSRYSDPYDAEIATVDAILERFLGELRRRDLYDRALIVLTSDHGEGLGDHGEAEHGVLLYREVLHVPLILKLPKGEWRGKRVTAPAGLTDLLPTLAAAVGAKVPDGLEGVSLIDLATGRATPDRSIYSETMYPRLHLGWSELRSLTDARHHFIESPDSELFDVVADPAEKRNIREDRRREYRALADQLRSMPLNLTVQSNADPEEMARLAALGYLSGQASAGDGPRRNPRDHIGVLARVQQTFVLNQQGRYRESIELCREILGDYPDLVDVYNQLAGNLRRLGRLQEARDTYREAIRRSPQLVDSLAIEVAKVELDLGDLKAAELNAQQAMKLNPAEAHLIIAAVAMKQRDFQKAEREARLALDREDRPRVPALILLARILVEQGRLNDALAAADRAATRIREDGAAVVPTLASTRGDILARMGRIAEAETALREEIARFPTTTDAYVRLALLYASQRRFQEITPTLEAMVKASPTPAAYALAARAMSDFGNDAGAREFQRRGAALKRR